EAGPTYSVTRSREITSNNSGLSGNDIDKIIYYKQGKGITYNTTKLPEVGLDLRLLLTLQSLNLQAPCVFSQEDIQEIKENDRVIEMRFKHPVDITISQRIGNRYYRTLGNVKRALFIMEDNLDEGLKGHILVGSEREKKDERCSWKVTKQDREKYKELGPLWSMIAGYEFDEERGCIPVGGSKYIKDVVPFKTKEECELACGRMWSCWAIEKGDGGLNKGWIDEINEIISTEEYLGIHCCEECLEAFSECPIAVGPVALMCGKFSSGYNMSEECREYFKEHPASVAKCESLLNGKE
ncbi:MAG TPA: hypothetical protein C5S37_13095, partial [Methanophagales archaeon]|nr:hypothetical protein [Methanophagales archaeon]